MYKNYISKKAYAKLLPWLFSLTLLCVSRIDSFAATFTVNNTTWTNTPGSLLWCINQANATVGPHTINFTNNGVAYVIQANSQINLTSQVTIDGSTSGFLVELNGTNATNTNGIMINAGASGSVIRGLFITQYDYNAIHVLAASNVQIGGDRSLNYGNVFSGNVQGGLRIENAIGTIVHGNMIGTNATGTAALSNGFDGINIIGTSTTTTIGGINVNLRNVISGNGFNGINIENGANTIIGNYIGTNGAGTAAIPNSQQGIRLVANANGTIIGGTTTNHRNLISGNLNNGIYAFAGSHTITANYIGTNATGTAAIPNVQNGITIESTSTANTIGGNNANLRNLISGNTYNGVNLFSGANTIAANYIGTTANGTSPLGNGRDGIRIAGTSDGNTIGGTTAASRNIIASNGYNGIEIEFGAHTVLGNYIGTNAAGTSALGNVFDGIRIAIASTNNVIGAGNVISGNTSNGVRILFGSHSIKGNYIGTDASGSFAVPNNLNGINLIAAGDDNIIGGLTLADRNIISGNRETGLRSDNTESLKVWGNIIGLDASGLNDLGNGIDGIYCRDFANNHEIGGNTEAHKNIISGNGRDGIFYEFNIANLKIEGNYIGTDSNGEAGVGNLGNSRNGISFNNGTTGTEINNNVVSGNGLNFKNGQDNGVGIFGYSSTGYTISNNIVGLEADGLVPLGNTENGISLIISNAGVISGNVVSSNGSWHTDATATASSPISGQLPFGHGVVLNSSSDISVLGNYLGVNKNGEGDFGNLQSGLIFIFGNNFTVGSTSSADRNIIGNNLEFGIHFVQVGSNVSVKNNLIGESISGLPIGNNSGGIFLDGANATNNITLGGSLENESNVIANSSGTFQRFASACGVCISGNPNVSGINNLIFNNSITCNAGLGIDLNLSGNMYDRWSSQYWSSPSIEPITGVGNNRKTAPVVNPSNSQTTVSGSGVIGDTVHVYDNTCDCEGETYLATTTIDTDGTWEVNLTTPITDNARVSAIAVDANNNTSEFSTCCRVKSDSLFVDKQELCLGDSTTILLVDHVGSNFQLQISSSASGPWTNVDTAKTTRLDSTWVISPSTVGTAYFRVYSEATSWGGTSTTTCNSTSEVISITTNPGISATVVNITQPTCGLSNGSFTINTTGGTSPITYSIDDSLTFSNTSTYSNQGPSDYSIVVIDNNLCIAKTTISLDTSAAIVIDSVKSTAPTECTSSDGTITIFAAGLSNPLEYSINDGVDYQASNVFTGLSAAGSPYAIKVRYANSTCEVSYDSNITFSSPSITLTLSPNKTFLCETDTLKITPTILGATGETQVNWNSGESSDSIYVLSPVASGTYSAVVTDEIGCTKNASVEITVESLPTTALLAADFSICADSTEITANTPDSGTGTWSILSGAGTIKDNTSASTTLTNLSTSTTELIWTISNGICPSSSDTISITKAQELIATDAGDNQSICSSTTILDASFPLAGTAMWSTNSLATINDLLDPKTEVTNLSFGENYFFWTVSNGVCEAVSDTVLIVRESVAIGEIPLITSDKSSIEAGDSVTITQNPKQDNIRWYSSLDKITWTLLASTDSFLIANPTEPTYYTAIVDVSTCTEINLDTLYIDIIEEEKPPMVVYEAVTPNDDGFNEYMRIENIEYYPNTNVQIYNRWGNMVWELPNSCNGYQNEVSNCSFIGKSNIGLGSGGEVPDGSYYYIVDGSADGITPCQGYLVKR